MRFCELTLDQHLCRNARGVMTGEEQPPFRDIFDSFSHGEVIPFLGSGASLPDTMDDQWEDRRFPKADELAVALARQSSYPDDAPIDLAQIAQYYGAVSGRERLTNFLHDIFVCKHEPTSLHRFLARTMRRGIIITTNYDQLVEQAFSERPHDIVVHAVNANLKERVWLKRWEDKKPTLVAPRTFAIGGEDRPLIYKMHGTADPRDDVTDEYLITEDDYVDFLSRMSRQTALPSPVVEALMKSTILFLGYGLRDWNLRVVLNGVSRQVSARQPRNKRVLGWAIQHQVSRVEQRAWADRGVNVWQLPISDFIARLEELEQAGSESAPNGPMP